MTPKLAAAAVLLPVALGSAAEAATWTADPAKSRLGFSGQQTGTPFTGRFKTWAATIDFDPAHPEAARIAATVNTASATTDDPQKDEALPAADWFDASQFATATFAAAGFTPEGGDAYAATGRLTLRGVSRDVMLPFTLTIAGDEAHARGHAKLVRTDFGVGQGTWSNGDYVALDVDVDVDLVATRKP
jgi:polyisoprenoid-binding protein YceI